MDLTKYKKKKKEKTYLFVEGRESGLEAGFNN
jgi:uncharacterized protein YcgL (UPF0745 family)